MAPPRLVPLLLAVLLSRDPLAAGEKAEKWIEVRSPNFAVVSNAREKKARDVARQFEIIRGVFEKAFSKAPIEFSQPIIILAVKDEETLKTLLPQFWEKKGQARPAGLCLSGEEKHYMVLELDLPTADRYHGIYHEYVHLLTSRGGPGLPLWFSEGIAEFYASSRIEQTHVWLGAPSGNNIQILRLRRLLPLEVLLSADRSSPYYTKQDTVPLFYAQSWALTHYLITDDWREKGHRVAEFLRLLDKEVNPKEAAERAFGDLKKLQEALNGYIERFSFAAARVEAPPDVDEKAFPVRELSPAESAAVRGDFLVRNRRPVEARGLLEEALRHDPNCALAHESMGLLFLHENQQEEAAKWFAQAAQLDSKNFLAHYFHAVLLEKGSQTSEIREQIEKHLERAINLNTNFAAGYAELARVYSLTAQKLETALGLARRAIVLEPGEPNFRLLVADILVRMDRLDEAMMTAAQARTLAKSLGQQAAADSFVTNVRWYMEQKEALKRAQEEARAAAERRRQELEEQEEVLRQVTGEAPPAEPETEEGRPAVASVRTTAEGKIVSVRCTAAKMNLTLALPAYELELHAKNYLRIEFLTTNWTPPDPFKPCQHIQGRRARIVYTAGGANPGEIISVELGK